MTRQIILEQLPVLTHYVSFCEDAGMLYSHPTQNCNAKLVCRTQVCVCVYMYEFVSVQCLPLVPICSVAHIYSGIQ